MKLHLRLALPLFGVAVGVTAAGTLGVVALVGRTFGTALAQSGRQLTQIAEHVLRSRTLGLDDAAAALARRPDPLAGALHGGGARLDAAGIVDRRTGRLLAAAGAAPRPADLAALARGPAIPAPLLLRAGDELLIAGATGYAGDALLYVGQRLGPAFAAALKEFLRADLSVVVDGRRIATTLPAGADAAELAPVAVPLPTPSGAAAALVIHLPARELHAARRDALAATVVGGVLLLAVALVFYWYTVIRVTRPLNQLIAATERIAAGDLSAHLPAEAPGELGALIGRFNAMAVSLHETQERLVHSAKLSSVGALVAGVSHELNNPLLGLLGHAEYLGSKLAPGAPGREELDVILAEGQRMKRILADLRGFVRPSAADRTRLDFNAIATEVLSLVRHEADQAGVACAARLRDGGVHASASPDQVRQAALNLVLNALQATPRGGRITVSTGVEAADGRTARARLDVEDTGAGIPPEVLPRVTEPFFSTKPGRMGLGLAICREVADRHGGELLIDTAPGRGTRMTLALPADGG